MGIDFKEDMEFHHSRLILTNYIRQYPKSIPSAPDLIKRLQHILEDKGAGVNAANDEIYHIFCLGVRAERQAKYNFDKETEEGLI